MHESHKCSVGLSFISNQVYTGKFYMWECTISVYNWQNGWQIYKYTTVNYTFICEWIWGKRLVSRIYQILHLKCLKFCNNSYGHQNNYDYQYIQGIPSATHYRYGWGASFSFKNRCFMPHFGALPFAIALDLWNRRVDMLRKPGHLLAWNADKLKSDKNCILR